MSHPQGPARLRVSLAPGHLQSQRSSGFSITWGGVKVTVLGNVLRPRFWYRHGEETAHYYYNNEIFSGNVHVIHDQSGRRQVMRNGAPLDEDIWFLDAPGILRAQHYHLHWDYVYRLGQEMGRLAMLMPFS